MGEAQYELHTHAIDPTEQVRRNTPWREGILPEENVRE